MSDLLRYDPSASSSLIATDRRETLVPALEAARAAVLDDARLVASSDAVPDDRRPLDAGFVNLASATLADDRPDGEIARIEACGRRLRDELDRVVLLGVGGSSMGPRALFAALVDRYHNQHSRDERQGIPRFVFAGDHLDNDSTAALLDLLAHTPAESDSPAGRWGVVVTSRSGTTLEPSVALRLLLLTLQADCGPDDLSRRIVVVTGDDGGLRRLADRIGDVDRFVIPAHIGGRFSVFTAVGLLPAAILGLDIRRLLEGAAAMTDRFGSSPPGDNPVLDHVATAHLAELDHGLGIRVLSAWSESLESVGHWHDQLLAESLGKHERGATPITTVNTRDLHSRGQQHQDGRRDKLITNLLVESSSAPPLLVPRREHDDDELNRLAGATLPDLQAAAIEGTNRAYAADRRPTADIILPQLDEFALGQLMQMLMLAVAVEGALVGTNPYGQPGVEAYKRHMNSLLDTKGDHE